MCVCVYVCMCVFLYAAGARLTPWGDRSALEDAEVRAWFHASVRLEPRLPPLVAAAAAGSAPWIAALIEAGADVNEPHRWKARATDQLLLLMCFS